MKPTRCVFMFCLIVTFAVASFAGDGGDGDWTRWRGPDGNGVSSETDWNPKALEKPKVVWRTDIGKGHSTIAVYGNRLFTLGDRETSAGGNEVYEEVVYCLDASSGKEVWSYAFQSRPRDFPGPGASPVLDGDRLYVTARTGQIFCFEAESGMVLWKRDLVADNLAREPQWGFCASPAIEGDLVLLNAGLSGVALHKKTGKVVWASEPEMGWLATPAVFDFKGKRLAAISGNRSLHVVDVATGEVQWSYPWHSDADPTVLGTQVHLIGAGRGNGSALIDFASGEPELVWENDTMAGVFQSAVIIDGHAYGLSRDRGGQRLQCVNMADGELKWTQDVGDWAALMAAGDRLIVAGGNGDLFIAKAAPDAYTELSRATVLQMRDWRSYPREEPNACWIAPVLANGKIYARNTHGNLVCVDVAS